MSQLYDISWTSEQLEFLDLNKKGKFVVKACPGSGKTTAVTERLYRLIKNWSNNKSGIAALSFTNVAADELIKNFEKNQHNLKIQYPHFVGTLDSFINKFIFLPYGNLVMECDGRPTLVGNPISHWSSDDYLESFFDKVDYLIGGGMITKYTINAEESEVILMKHNLTKKGFATQKDAIYHAMRVLEQFPEIAKALSLRFPCIIIDEAQDTTDIHMRIIDLLIENGLENIILVGDPEQALYEWNNAKPDLFNKKYLEWEEESIEFKTNFRSSQKICDFFSKLSKIDFIESQCTHDFEDDPKIIPIRSKEYNSIIVKFIKYCESKGIKVTKDNVCVLFRGGAEVNKLKKTFNKRDIFRIFSECPSFNKSYTLNILEGLYFWNNNDYLNGFKIIEKEYLKIKNNTNHVYLEDINQEIKKFGFQKYRLNVYNFIKKFPTFKNNQKINLWIKKVNRIDDFIKLCELNDEYSDLTFELLFKGSLDNNELNYNVGTVHSVKGDAFDAVLLILKNKANRRDFYQNILNSNCYLCEEELRIIYVALSRPKKILQIAVPRNNFEMWESIFK